MMMLHAAIHWPIHEMSLGVLNQDRGFLQKGMPGGRRPYG